MSSHPGSSTTANITLLSAASGQSESIPLPLESTSVAELTEWAQALLGLNQSSSSSSSSSSSQSPSVTLLRHGQPLGPPQATLRQVGVQDGDLLVVQPSPGGGAVSSGTSTTSAPLMSTTTSGSTTGGGLDFSNLLVSSSATTTTTTTSSSSNLLPSSPSSSTSTVPPLVYYPGMSLTDAREYNPHPQAMVTLLFAHDHLLKELNYHHPAVAQQLRSHQHDVARAAVLWREFVVKDGIQQAVAVTEYHRRRAEMQQRIARDPNDAEAQAYFQKQDRQEKVQQQFHQMMQEYPESMGRVLMLYIEAKINGHAIQAFCDSGAQSTIMSQRLAEQCGLADYIDTRFAGMAVGVGTGKILGRIHLVQMQIGDGYYFHCSVTVMAHHQDGADKEMPFLLGLDMMKRHTCHIDLENGVLKFRLAAGQYMEAPFLHEKDLDARHGGTKGFDAEKANQELLEKMSSADDEPPSSEDPDDQNMDSTS